MTGYHHETHERHELEEAILGCEILDVAKNRRNVARTGCLNVARTPNNKTNGGRSFHSMRHTRYRNGATNVKRVKKQEARCSMHHLYWNRVATARLYKIVCCKPFLSERPTRQRNGAPKGFPVLECAGASFLEVGGRDFLDNGTHNVYNRCALKHHYFVDESGDLTLFDKRGRGIVGTEGVSRTFMVGVARIPDPRHVHEELDRLRTMLLSDPYFKGLPSLRPDAGKTAMLFHAKDDAPEVRREVIKLIVSFGCQVMVAVKRKSVLVEEARQTMDMFGTKLDTNDVYDELIKRLFKNLLHKAEQNVVIYARRGKAHRRDAFQKAIERAKHNFEKQYGIAAVGDTLIECSVPSSHPGLQVVDYYLWAVQRLYERGEDRFFNALAQDYKLIMDLDDTRSKRYGEWYSKTNPLGLKKIMPLED